MSPAAVVSDLKGGGGGMRRRGRRRGWGRYKRQELSKIQGNVCECIDNDTAAAGGQSTETCDVHAGL